MGRHILTVTLNPVLDYSVKVPGFSLGRDFYAPEFNVSAGGKGINVSRALKNLGIENLATGILGGPSGNLMKELLDRERIRHDFVKIAGPTRKSLTVIDPPGLTRVIEQGPRVNVIQQKIFLQKFKALLKDCQGVVIAGRPPEGVPDYFCRDLIRTAQLRGIGGVLDTAGKSLQIGLKASPFLVKPNREETEAILKFKINNFARLKKAVCHFQEFGVKIVLISLGPQGAVAASGSDCWFAAAPQVKIQNTVGCGDAMLAGFLYQYSYDQDVGRCLQTAVAAGSANCLNAQPGDIRRGQILSLRRKIKLQRLK